MVSPKPCIALCLSLLFLALSTSPLLQAEAPHQNTREIIILYHGKSQVTTRVDVSETALSTLKTMFDQLPSRLSHARNQRQVESIFAQTFTELDSLHLIPSGCHWPDLIRPMTDSFSRTMTGAWARLAGSEHYINGMCLLYLSAFDVLDVNIYALFGLLLSYQPVRVLEAIGLGLLFYSFCKPFRCMDTLLLHSGLCDAYFTMGMHGMKTGSNMYGNEYLTSVLGFTGIKIILPFHGSVFDHEDYYIGVAVLALQ